MSSILNNFSTGLVAHWDLDEASGVRYDSHTNGFNLSDGNTVGSATGALGNCADFNDADSDYLEVAHNSAMNLSTKATWSFWIKHDDTTLTQYESIFAKANSFGSRSYMLYTDIGSTKYRFLFSGNNFGDVTLTPATSSFDHFVYVYDGTLTGNAERLKVYKNGTQQTLSFVGTVPSSITNNTDAFTLGYVDGDISGLDGFIDHFTFWKDFAATSGNATTLYNGGTPLPYDEVASSTFTPRVMFFT